MTTTNPAGDKTEAMKVAVPADSAARTPLLSYFIVTVLGFSFWFFMAVPFASHRESYWWLGMVQKESFATAFSFISTTYRPLAQGLTWAGFLLLDPGTIPTNVVRQTLFQGFIYGMFVAAWWLVYSKAAQRRLLALIAFVAGGVFFSGYVHLFHIYGLFYIPVMLTLGAVLRRHALGTVRGKWEVWFAAGATLLALWHPFATALFMGFYFGFYLETFWQRSKAEHIRALSILLIGAVAIVGLVVPVPRTGIMTMQSRIFGFLVSYQTNEINLIASFVAFALTQMVVFSLNISRKAKAAAFVVVSLLAAVCLAAKIPILMLWVAVVLAKLVWMRSWSLAFLMAAAAVLPFGGGIGTPIYALYAIIVAIYSTALGWTGAEDALSAVKPRYAIAATIALVAILIVIRVGTRVPILTSAASPLLMERERTYQLENVLAWMHKSSYCGYDIAFNDAAASPIDSLESAINRRNRPPAWIKDVQLYWNAVLQCREPAPSPTNGNRTAVVTFGEQRVAGAKPVFVLPGKYAGDATVWIGEPR